MELKLYYDTIIHCKFIQIYSRLTRKFPKNIKRFSTKNLKIRENFRISQQLIKRRTWLAEKKFRFLNKEVDFGNIITWSNKSLSKLWRYNLHYFDYLNQELTPDNSFILIQDWIENNPIGSEDAWEPYTTSLRVVNWIKYFERIKKIPDHFLTNLATQVDYLYKNIEFHLLANHLFANAVALIYAGHFFDIPDAKRWLERGENLLIKQIHEQILPDGGHYELSPMYHCIILENILDCWNIYKANSLNIPVEIIDSANQMVIWLYKLQTPNGLIPLFNDSAYNVSSEIKDLIDYWKNLSGDNLDNIIRSYVELKYSGYYICNDNEFYIIIDAGESGPSYQPSHSHCDMLSFELWRKGYPIIVDTGVYEYEPSETRKYLRANNAHNTVKINGLDQFETWGSFRVAKRAKIIESEFCETNTGFLFSGSYRNYLGDIHKRKIQLKNKFLLIEDNVESKECSIVESYLHFSPAISLFKKNSKWFGMFESENIFFLQSNWQKEELCTGEFYPEFGKKQFNKYLYFCDNVKTKGLQLEINWL
jgi:uncharacterized heparinase superfamily protein